MRWRIPILLIFSVCFALPTPSWSSATCGGRVFNPITDVDWMGIFPIKIGGIPVVPIGEDTNTVSPFPPFCICFDGIIPRIGIKVSFWEPIRLIEVVRGPGCFPSLGGITIPIPSFAKRGAHASTSDRGESSSFLHVHYFIYPVLEVVGLFSDLLCLSDGGISLAYMSEFDPLWNNDDLSFLVNPEAAIVANPVAQAACAADAVSASFGFPIDQLFWCDGSWGSMYPFTGTVSESGDLPAVYGLAATRLLAKRHRLRLEPKTVGEEALCHPIPAPIIVKSQYKLQIAYPKPGRVFPLGRATIRWAPGNWYPGLGEDWTWVLWRKRDCCVF
ncbi:MAG: TraU family protein [Ignavibacteriales bacterium]